MAPPEGGVGYSNQYGSLTGKNFDEEELRPLTTTTTDGGSFSGAKNSCSRKLKSKVVIAGAVAVLCLGVTLWSHRRQGSFSSDNDKTSNMAHPPVLESPTALGLTSMYRQDSALPSEVWGKHATEGPLPTNSWYLNLVSHRAATQPDASSNVYTVPYKIDTAPPKEKVAAGVRVHWPVLQASTNNIQMVDDFKNMLALGASTMDPKYLVNPDQPLSPLGVSLQWKGKKDPTQTMVSHLVRGMPYVTMQYHGGVLPRLYSYNGPASEVETDGTKGNLVCGVAKDGEVVTVQNEMKLHLANSDFTWIVFFSRPVQVTCQISSKDVQTNDLQVDVTSYDGQDSDEPLVVRLALLDQCTSGSSNIAQHCAEKGFSDPKAYETMLREHVSVIPTSPKIDFAYASAKKSHNETMTIDWGVQKHANNSKNDDIELLSFALPHHQASLSNYSVNITDQCINTFHGNTCLVKGNRWTLSEDLGPAMSFTASRPPEPTSIPTLAQTLSEDLQYKLSDNMKRGAADTYFSGKLLARLGRVVVIANELLDLAAGKAEYDDVDDDSLALATKAAAAADLPSKESVKDAVEQLKQGVEIWLTKPEATYLYDKSWGGFVNCGCRYTGKGGNGYCNNTFPDCPAMADVNEDFGNAWYADHHYHYGYHVYAAAVVAKFDPAWGEKFFDEIMLYIRDFANPFEDEYFTPFRQKDWFLGSSWASGIVSAETSPHGRDEESSSEAIAAYEAVTLFGSVMADHFAKSNNSKLKTAEIVRDAGQLLVATELSATNRYWHVWNSATHNSTYPAAYTLPVVGMMHETMASFGTWFSPQPVVSYGIQLMPLTPVAEQRDVPEWATQLYPLYKKSCEQAGDFCVDNGWSILQAGLLATTGDHEGALKQAMEVPSKVFDSQGGLGNSRSNLVWYISTRKAYSPES
eukprot:scaffold2651_cov171-Amphora_coffeaeformis.AAC.5